MMNYRQHTLDQEYAIDDNLNLYKILIDVIDTNNFENFDSKEMYNALLKLKIFVRRKHRFVEHDKVKRANDEIFIY